ncbi:MAG: DNA-directed RNA polymerase subunit beta', partial [Deltaproteobacteria bacterium]|nr:DNA-directed RNA polymerase subunit beta' [Deltaproteobacteria bacterium]
GYKYATISGISIAMKDMVIPSEKETIIHEAENEVKKIEEQYVDGLITSGEKYNKVVDIWSQSTENVAAEMMKEMAVKRIDSPELGLTDVASFNAVYMMSDSGARGSKDQMRQLAGMRGLMAKPSGEIIETPITSNFREGLTVLQYFISTHGARKGLADTALKTANSGYLTRRLVDVSQEAIITEDDCGTIDGIWVESLLEGGEVLQRVGERILGRVASDDIEDPVTGDVLVGANEAINEEEVELIEKAGIEKVRIRSVLTCEARRGVCKKCYGRDLAHGHEVNMGEAVGVIAAQSIGEPGTQLTMRTFHIGGTASRRVEQSTIQPRNPGEVKFIDLKTVLNAAGDLVVMNRNGEMAILGKGGREVERYPIIYGAALKVRDGQTVEPSQVLAEWDPFTIPILTEVPGVVKFGDIIEDRTLKEKRDTVTGKISRIIVESRETDARPRISIKDSSGKTSDIPGGGKAKGRYQLPVGAIIMVNEGETVGAGTVLAKIPRETTKTKDITGGLPRVAELFEVRKPKETAIISEIDGVLSFGKNTKGKRKMIVTPEVGDAVTYLVPKGKHVSVLDGDYVRAGEALMDGSADPHDILKIRGMKELAKYLVNEVQEVYRLQGVRINDKHIEVIVRQMVRQVSVTDVGDSGFLLAENVEKWRFQEVNNKLIVQGKQPASAEALLLGITKASLNTESFISAASFQETTKVLSEASIAGKEDGLKGLKENVIMGRLIPAGTGLESYRSIEIGVAG